MKVVQSMEALEAIQRGSLIGVIRTIEGDEVALFEYKRDLFASLKGPVSQSMFSLLVHLEVTTVISEIISCERPGKLFGKYECVTRCNFVRLDESGSV